MGITIDQELAEISDLARDVQERYLKFKNEYETKIKIDMIAMLTELQLEIEETVKEEELIDKKWANGLHYSEKIIQQKIDKMRED